MLSINTNLSSMIVQNSMGQATFKLNQAIERMSTGFKINHASDNAANYSISTNMTTKMSAYQVAEDNTAMGLDMVTTLSENLDLVSEHARRIRDLCEQASNGTYGNQSLQAIQSEIDARLAEITRLKSSAEFNGIKLLESEASELPMHVTGSFIEEVDQLTEEEAIAQGYTIIKTADELQAMQDNPSGKYILMNDIDLEGYNWTPIGTNYTNNFTGELNGNGFVIKNLTIDKPAQDKLGLFGNAVSCKISNLGITNASIKGNNNLGILVGESGLDAVTIQNVYVQGTIVGNDNVGGMVGLGALDSQGIIESCYADVNITANNFVGGFIGNAWQCSSFNIRNSYTNGSVKGSSSVGGFYGEGGSSDIFENAYTSCSIQASSDTGAIIGSQPPVSNYTNVYWDTQKCGVAQGDGSGTYDSVMIGVSSSELQELINNGTLPKAKPPVIPTPNPVSITLQVGTNGDTNSQITFDLATTLSPLEITITDSDSARASLSVLDNYLAQISEHQTNLGAVTNRLESALDEIAIQYDNLASSRSTLRDADMAELSSTYIQQQILQQASATLLATANQSPSIALQLI